MADAGQKCRKISELAPRRRCSRSARILYAADLARPPAREAGWVAVVEGYTDVIAAHQVGLANVVGTLGTALGDDHVAALRRLADRVVLVFDGDEAGQKAADRSLELFLGHEVDVRVLTLPADLDPCDFLLSEGAEAFRELVERAVDPLTFAIDRAAVAVRPRLARGVAAGGRVGPGDPRPGARAGPASGSTSRWPRPSTRSRAGSACRSTTLERRLRRSCDGRPGRAAAAGAGRPRRRPTPERPTARRRRPPPIRLADLDPIDRELIQIVLNEPDVVGRLITRVPVASTSRRPAACDPPGLLRPPRRGAVADLRSGRPAARRPGRAGPGGRPAPADRAGPVDPRTVRPGPWRGPARAASSPGSTERERQDRLRDLEARPRRDRPRSRPGRVSGLTDANI